MTLTKSILCRILELMMRMMFTALVEKPKSPRAQLDGQPVKQVLKMMIMSILMMLMTVIVMMLMTIILMMMLMMMHYSSIQYTVWNMFDEVR